MINLSVLDGGKYFVPKASPQKDSKASIAISKNWNSVKGGGYNLRRRPMYPVASKIVSRNYLNNFIISNVWSILNELKFSTICGNRFFIGHILYLKLENFFLFVYLFK